MAAFEEFKQKYKEEFIDNPDFRVSDLIRSGEDIPCAAQQYRTMVSQAFQLLSGPSSNRLPELKLLKSYADYMRMNQRNAMTTSPVEFAAMLYLLHYMTLRILRSPWRKEYLSLKAYNGFYYHTLSTYLDEPVIFKLMEHLGFRFNAQHGTFEFMSYSLNRSARNSLITAGIDFFLSYTHCMMKNDRDFYKKMKYQNSQETTKVFSAASMNHHTLISSKSRPDEGFHSLGIRQSNDSDPHIIYPSTSQQMRSHLSGRSSENRSQRDEMQESPLDLSVDIKNHSPRKTKALPYHHHKKILSKSERDRKLTYTGTLRQYNDFEDLELYEKNESSDTNSSNHGQSAEPLEVSLENSVNGRVLYPPNPHSSVSGLNESKFDSSSQRANANYVQFVPPAHISPRGSPDGEINKEEVHSCHRKYSTEPKHSPRVSKYSNRHHPNHLYHEINDRNTK